MGNVIRVSEDPNKCQEVLQANPTNHIGPKRLQDTDFYRNQAGKFAIKRVQRNEFNFHDADILHCSVLVCAIQLCDDKK